MVSGLHRRFLLVLSATCVTLLVPQSASAEDRPADKYVFEVSGNKKIIHISELCLSENTSVLDIIHMFPELLNRPTKEDLLSSYDVQIDGISIGKSRDAIMASLIARDIDKISISEDCDKSYKTNGQGGVINIVLNQAKEGLTARASLAVNSLLNVMPSAIVVYKKDKLQVNALCCFDYNHSVDRISEKESMSSTESLNLHTKTDTDNDMAYEMARVKVMYNPFERDFFDFIFTEDYSWNKQHLTNYLIKQENEALASEQGSIIQKLNIDATLKYRHLFRDNSSVKAEINYVCGPGWSDRAIPLYDQVERQNKENDVAYNVFYAKPFKFDDCSFNLETGVNSKFCFGHRDFLNTKSHCLMPRKFEFDENGNTYYVSPYATATIKYKSLDFNLNMAYQYFAYEVENHLYEKHNVDRHDFTGYLTTNWQIVSHHHLRLDLRRKLRRPNGGQIYPYLSFDEENVKFYKGNTSLVPMILHNVGLEYISDYNTKAGYFTVNAGINFIHVQDIIQKTSLYEKIGKYTAQYTYGNSGSDNVFNVNLLLYYRIAFFNLSLCASTYNGINAQDTKDILQYYTFSVAPYFTMPKNWVLTLQATYLSKVRQLNSVLGDISFGKISLSKGWKNFVFALNGQIPFIKYTVDNINAPDVTTVNTYQSIYPYAGISINYYIK